MTIDSDTQPTPPPKYPFNKGQPKGLDKAELTRALADEAAKAGSPPPRPRSVTKAPRRGRR